MKQFLLLLTSLMLFSCNSHEEGFLVTENEKVFSASDFEVFAEGIEFYLTPEEGMELDENILYVLEIKLIIDKQGYPQTKLIDSQEISITNKNNRISNQTHSNTDNRTDSSGRKWKHCKVFSGSFKKLNLAKWLGDNFGDCDCVETRTQIEKSGDWLVFADCC